VFAVRVDTTELDAVMANLVDARGTLLQQLVVDVSADVQGAARTVAPVRRSLAPDAPLGGTLRDSLRMVVGTLGAVLYGAAHAAYVIEGTLPHRIVPRRARMLRFFWERMGETVVFARVMHPGTRPQDFRMPAVDLAMEMGLVDESIAAFFSALVEG
jgi:hypothetical protein